MTWVTVFPLRTATIGARTPRHFCLGETPFFPLELRGLAKSKMSTSRGKNGGHVPLESVTHVMRLSQTRALPGPRCAARYYFLTTSAFSIIAMPPRSASLPFKVTFFPHKSAS